MMTSPLIKRLLFLGVAFAVLRRLLTNTLWFVELAFDASEGKEKIRETGCTFGRIKFLPESHSSDSTKPTGETLKTDPIAQSHMQNATDALTHQS